MGWLAGSLVVTMVTWTLLTTVTMSSPVVEVRRVRRSAAADQDNLRRDVAADLSPDDRLSVLKRPWGRNNVAVWGKRSAVDLNKRRWGQNSLALWGKRSYDEDDDQQWGGNDPLTKRRWGQRHMAIWGKRDDDPDAVLNHDTDQPEALKRKWGQKNLALWG